MATFKEKMRLTKRGRGEVDTTGLFPVDAPAAAATAVAEVEVLPRTREYEDDDTFDRHVPRGRSMPAALVPKQRGGEVRPDVLSVVDTKPEKYFADARIVARALLYVGEDHPRKYFDIEEVRARRSSMRLYGVIQPLIVREVMSWEKGVETRFGIIKGALRFYASLPHSEFVAMFPEARNDEEWAGIGELPVVVRDISREDATVISTVLAVQQAGLNPIERGIAFKKIKADMAAKLGRSVTWPEVAERLQLSRKRVIETAIAAELPEDMQDAVRDAGLNQRQTVALTTLRKNPVEMHKLFNRMVKHGMSGDEALAQARMIKHRVSVPAEVPAAPVAPAITPSDLNDDLAGIRRMVSMVAARVNDFGVRRAALKRVPVSIAAEIRAEAELLRRQADALDELVA